MLCMIVCSLKSSMIEAIMMMMNRDREKRVCYDSSYAPSLIAMLMAILRAIVDRSSLEHRLVSKSTLFRVSLCSSESYR